MTQTRPRKRTVIAISGTVVLVVAAGVLIGALARPVSPTAAGTSSPLAARTAPAVPAASATPTPVITERAMTPATAEAAVTGYARAVDAITPKSDVASFAGLISGRALDEVQAQALEFKANGWTVTGTTTVDHVKVLQRHPNAAPPSAVVQACVDSSRVAVKTASGKPAFPSSSTTTHRALNLYTLHFTGGAWRIVSHSFPAKTAC